MRRGIGFVSHFSSSTGPPWLGLGLFRGMGDGNAGETAAVLGSGFPCGLVGIEFRLACESPSRRCVAKCLTCLMAIIHDGK